MKALLLSRSYQGISFIPFRKIFKLVTKGKVDVLSEWEEEIHWSSGKMKIPAVLKLKYEVRWIPKRVRFNRASVFKRDKFVCQYCYQQFAARDLTIDHIVPRIKGGKNEWTNCVAACSPCNTKKGDGTPEEANLILLNDPSVPKFNIKSEYLHIKPAHPDWKFFLGI